MAQEMAGALMRQGSYIRFKGMVDFPAIWKMISDWFESKGFEVLENKAKHRMAPFGEELETTMTAWRNVTEYYRYEMIVYHKYWDAQKVDVVKDGVKKRMIKARMVFRVTGKMVFDYSDRYETSKLTKALGNFMYKYVLHWQWDVIYGDQLNYKILELQDVIKTYLKLETTGSEFADMW